MGAAWRSVLGHKPTVLLLDLNMPGGSSLEAIPRINGQGSRNLGRILTMQDDPAFAREALQVGARGYVLKRTPRPWSSFRPSVRGRRGNSGSTPTSARA